MLHYGFLASLVKVSDVRVLDNRFTYLRRIPLNHFLLSFLLCRTVHAPSCPRPASREMLYSHNNMATGSSSNEGFQSQMLGLAVQDPNAANSQVKKCPQRGQRIRQARKTEKTAAANRGELKPLEEEPNRAKKSNAQASRLS